MTQNISPDDLKQIEAGIRKRYASVAQRPEGQFAYPTGRKGLEAAHYDQALIDRLPDAVAAYYCGVGNPFALGPISSGDRVLDVGCGAGVDTILAAMLAAPEGAAIGVDIVPEMIARAEANCQLTGIANVKFQNAGATNLPFPADTFDVVISNGVINLIPEKETALSEILRVLKPSGRLMLADQVATGSIQKELKARLASWFH